MDFPKIFSAGTTKIKNLDHNIESLEVKLTEDEMKEISDAVPLEEVAGGRTYSHIRHVVWEFADTPAAYPSENNDAA